MRGTATRPTVANGPTAGTSSTTSTIGGEFGRLGCLRYSTYWSGVTGKPSGSFTPVEWLGQ